MSETNAADPFESVRASWGFPKFAKDFPRHPTLDALVAAFANGNYAAVRDGAPKLASAEGDTDVGRAATELLSRTKPDPAAKIVFLFAAALLVFLAGWWIAHDGPPEGESAAPTFKTDKAK